MTLNLGGLGSFRSAKCGLGGGWLQVLPEHVVRTVVSEVGLFLCVCGAEVVVSSELGTTNPGGLLAADLAFRPVLFDGSKGCVEGVVGQPHGNAILEGLDRCKHLLILTTSGGHDHCQLNWFCSVRGHDYGLVADYPAPIALLLN